MRLSQVRKRLQDYQALPGMEQGGGPGGRRTPRPCGQRTRPVAAAADANILPLVVFPNVARVPPSTSKGITDLFLPTLHSHLM